MAAKVIPDNVMLECIQSEKRFWTVYENFRRTMPQHPLIIKCCSRHSADEIQSETEMHAEYLEFVRNRKTRGPREKSEIPLTTSQVYGWLYDKAFVYYKDEIDKMLLLKPMVETEQTKHGIKMFKKS